MYNIKEILTKCFTAAVKNLTGDESKVIVTIHVEEGKRPEVKVEVEVDDV